MLTKNKILIFIFFNSILVLPLNVFSQTITWQKWYDFNNREDNGVDIVQTFDGNFVFISNNYGLNSSAVITKVNQYGNIIWQHELIGNSIGTTFFRSRSLSQTKDSGFVISGSKNDSAMLIKTNPNGIVIWFKKYGISGYSYTVFQDHKNTIDGGIIASGRAYNDAIGFIIRTDSIGNRLWSTKYDSTDMINSIIESDNNNFYMLGIDSKLSNRRSWLIKTNLLGEEIWRKRFEFGNAKDIHQLESGAIVVGGGVDSLILVKADTSGKIIFQKSYYSGNIGCEAMCLSLNNNICLVGMVRNGGNVEMAVSRIDENGSLIYNKVIPSILKPDYAFIPKAVKATSDNGFIFTGYTDYPDTFFESNIYVTKTDSSFIAPVIVKISNNSLAVKDFILEQNYPNPFNSFTKFKFHIKKSGNIELQIYDVLAKNICTIVSGFYQSGSYELSFNSDQYNLTSGVYYYKLKFKNDFSIKSFIIIK